MPKPSVSQPINWRPFWRYCAVVVCALAILVVAQITTSSIGILSETGATDASVAYGTPQAIRSDEYFRGSPREIGLLRNSDDRSFLTAFDVGSHVDPTALPTRVQKVMRILAEPERSIGRLVLRGAPIGMQFAFIWWIDSAVFLIFLPLMLGLIGVRWGVGVTVAALAWLSATNQWWSLNPMGPFAAAAAGVALVLTGLHVGRSGRSSRLRWVLAGLVAAAGGVRVAALAVGYIPWSFPIFLVFFAIAIGALAGAAAARRSKGVVLVAAASAALIGSGIALWSNAAVLRVTAATVYPGARRFSGGGSLPWFAGDTAGSLARHGLELIASNQSELALGIASVLPLSAIAYVVSVRHSTWRGALGLPFVSGTLAIALLLAWAARPWPPMLLELNPLTLVSPDRAIQIIGMLSLPLYALAIELTARSRFSIRRRTAIVCAAVIPLALAVHDGRTFAVSYLPAIGTASLVLICLIVTATSTLPFVSRRPVLALAPLVLVFAYIAFPINPLQQGIGALGSASVVTAIHSANAAAPGRWASDDVADDTLILAAGVPQLSGQQFGGPDAATWSTVDPRGEMSGAWNRAASFVTFHWDDSGQPTVANPSADIISISTSPCAPAMRAVGLRWILASSPQNQPCLIPHGSYLWRGNAVLLYEVTDE